jgi:hypothetical protein
VQDLDWDEPESSMMCSFMRPNGFSTVMVFNLMCEKLTPSSLSFCQLALPMFRLINSLLE